MTAWRDIGARLAPPMSRRPMRTALIALAVGALGALGLLRFAVDSGQSLLVGSTSNAASTYASFTSSFGADPIVLVFSATNPTAPYLETNLERLGALEIDLAHDPRVASVLGPGTVAGSLRQAAVSEVNRVLTEYPYFVAETDYRIKQAHGDTNTQELAQTFQSDYTAALVALDDAVVKAAASAHQVRAQYAAKPGDREIDSREKAVDAAVAQDPVPPLWAIYYTASPQPTADQQAAAQLFFARVTAAYGDCDDQIASQLKIAPSCQVFFERTLLDLPDCPAVSSHRFCDPKPEWAAVLPAPRSNGDSHEILTIRLKPQYEGDAPAVHALEDKINTELRGGITGDAYTRTLTSGARNALEAIGPLWPTECGGATAQQDPACNSSFGDARLGTVIAGAPLLGLGVVDSMKSLLAILVPVALFLMLVLLAGVFRVRGRVWPLVAAVASTLLTLGVALLTGTPITPAVLAGVPILVGLGVDYAVQLVARYSEERALGAAVDEALRSVIATTARSTGVAALATLAGLAALALTGGIDWGPLVAVPLVAEFALVLCGGVVLAWLAGLFIALPLAVWSDGRRPLFAGPAFARPASVPRVANEAARTIAIADNWRGVVAITSVAALFGWALLGAVPVQTDVQHLVSQSLPELVNIETAQAQTGYTNEIDIYLRGSVVTGPVDTQTGSPVDVEWQCSAAAQIRAEHTDTVAQATSIGDYVIASSSGSSNVASSQCVPANAGPSAPSPPPSPSASPPAAASASPSAFRDRPGVVAASRIVAQEAAATASPGASSTPTPTASATPSASPTATPSPRPSTAPLQTSFLCDLRLFPGLSRTLVTPISLNTVACPPIDDYLGSFITKDSTPINPSAARIAIGVATPSVSDQAKLVDSLRGDLANPPNGMSAQPTGLAVLATTAYRNLTSRAYLLNLAPILVVALALIAIHREPRRALLPLVPTVLAAGWAPLILLALGRIPGTAGSVLGSFNPLTVVLGASVVALGTEFGVVLLGRFDDECAHGLHPDAAAAAALHGTGRAIRVSALTLGAGFAVLAVSGLFPNAFPMVADFGFAVVIDLGLAVGAVFLVMLPLAVALQRRRPLMAVGEEARFVTPPAAPATPEAGVVATRRPLPGVSGRRRSAAGAAPDGFDGAGERGPAPPPEAAPRRPRVSGRKRRRT